MNNCLEQLSDKFQYLFEKDLIKELCHYGQLRHYKEEDLLMEIGQTITHIPIILSGSIKIMTEDKQGGELLLY